MNLQQEQVEIFQQARQVVARVRLLELGEDFPHYVILEQEKMGESALCESKQEQGEIFQQARQVVARVRLLELGEDFPHYVILEQEKMGESALCESTAKTGRNISARTSGRCSCSSS